MPKLSLVIPCYNEVGNLPSLVGRIAAVIDRDDIETILVDNGSQDGTASILPNLIAPHRFLRSVRVPVNQGYGFGILTGLRAATGDVLAWTHADLQTDPADVLAGLRLFDEAADPRRLFVKGSRYGRPLRDRLFTWGMAAFELLALGAPMWDINAQPTMFHRVFFESWQHPPHDFSLDLYAYYSAIGRGLTVRRFPVHFGPRLSGHGHNETLAAKIRYSRRTAAYSLGLRRRLKTENI